MSTDYQLADTPDSTRHYAAIDFPEGSCRTGAESMIVDGATAAEAEAKARDWVAENLRPGARPAITHWGSWADVQR